MYLNDIIEEYYRENFSEDKISVACSTVNSELTVEFIIHFHDAIPSHRESHQVELFDLLDWRYGKDA